IVVDTPPSRNALDFLDAPKRLGTFLNGKMIRLIMAPGRGVGRFVTGAMSLAMRGVSTIVGGRLLKEASTFLQSLEAMFGGFQERADRTYAMLSTPGTHFLVVAAPEPDALREASFFVDRLSSARMPLAGLLLTRTRPGLGTLPGDHALTAADRLADEDPLTTAVLRVHADPVAVAKRERHLLVRFTGAHPWVKIAAVSALPFEVADLDALRAVADQLTGESAKV